MYARGQQGRTEPVVVCVQEDGLRFDADLMGAAGKALVLSQRSVRGFVAREAAGKRFANLFATANAATVFAAKAGAKSTVTVDVSRERLAWVQESLGANGLASPVHKTACSEVLTWAASEARSKRRYDLILCAPPTSLAAHGARGKGWDIQRDLPELLRHLASVLAKDGKILLLLPPRVELPDSGFCARDVTAELTPVDSARATDLGHIYVLR